MNNWETAAAAVCVEKLRANHRAHGKKGSVNVKAIT